MVFVANACAIRDASFRSVASDGEARLVYLNNRKAVASRDSSEPVMKEPSSIHSLGSIAITRSRSTQQRTNDSFTIMAMTADGGLHETKMAMKLTVWLGFNWIALQVQTHYLYVL